MLWIISGPTSVGKSTFLASARCQEITGLSADAPVLFAFEKTRSDRELGNTFFHYNLLRPAEAYRRRQRSRSRRQESVVGVGAGQSEDDLAGLRSAALAFSEDPAWQAIRSDPVKKRAIVLMADRERILARVEQRREIEHHMRGNAANTYRAEGWIWLYERLDLSALYRAWCAELEDAGIEYTTIDSNDLRFHPCP